MPTVPIDEQMTTVWPVSTVELAKELNDRTLDTRLNSEKSQQVCQQAVNNYDLMTANYALEQAKDDADVSGKGPHLLAWSPASDKVEPEPDTHVLHMDLSYIETYSQAEELFERWEEDIERNPRLWRDGWSEVRFRVAIRNWADKYGTLLFSGSVEPVACDELD
jgi:hypothetical protein